MEGQHWPVRVLIAVTLSVLIAMADRPISFAADPVQEAPVVLHPASGDEVAEGHDYFTLELGQPSDMGSLTQMRWPVDVRGASIKSGVWSASFSAEGWIFPLFPGVDDGALSEWGSSAHRPLDGALYGTLSFRVRSTHATELYWWWYNGTMATGAQGPARTVLPAGEWVTGSVRPGWSGDVYGLGVQSRQEAGRIEFDWIRLSAAGTATPFDVTWEGLPGRGVRLEADLNRNRHDGVATLITAGTENTGTYSWDASALPPGRYWVHVTSQSDGTTATSAAPLNVVPTPRLRFEHPSPLSGPDYASEVLGRAWDMNDARDVLSDAQWPWTWHQLSAFPPSGGFLRSANTGPDPFFYLSVDPLDRPIDAARFHYLSWRWSVDGSWEHSPDRLSAENGWVTRYHYFTGWPYDDRSNQSTTNDILIWEGENTTLIDLARPHRDDAVPGPGRDWGGYVTGLRFDPLEGTRSFSFALDWIRLRADPEARPGEIVDLAWQLHADRPVEVALYYDADCRPGASGYDGAIGILTAPDSEPPVEGGEARHSVFLPAVHTAWSPARPTNFAWRVPEISGRFFVVAVVSNGLTSSTWCSEAPVHVQ